MGEGKSEGTVRCMRTLQRPYFLGLCAKSLIPRLGT
jgi:hypothetical protein